MNGPVFECSQHYLTFLGTSVVDCLEQIYDWIPRHYNQFSFYEINSFSIEFQYHEEYNGEEDVWTASFPMSFIYEGAE